MSATDRPQVLILTYCVDPKKLYGTLLTFETLRVGFPDAAVHVYDNFSHPDARGPIREAALSVGAGFAQLERRIIHSDFIRSALAVDDQDRGPLVFADPDLMFWERMELPEGDYLVAGRKLPRFFDEYTGTITEARLHTSLLMIPSRAALKKRIAQIEAKYWEMDAIRPTMIPAQDGIRRFDTLGVLFAMAPDACCAFSDGLLDRYDHLFCGSHLDVVAAKLKDPALFVSSHQQANVDYTQLRGIWRQQEEHFRARADGFCALT